MNLKHIEAFARSWCRGSMTAAAKELFTSQPNVSRLIAQLERETGLRLFQRSGVRLIPTSEGKAFFREVERATWACKGSRMRPRRFAIWAADGCESRRCPRRA